MQKSFEQKIRPRLALRNNPEYIRMRLTLRFSMLYFAMFTLGLLLCRYTFVGTVPFFRAQTAALFQTPFTNCEYARDYIRAILIFSRRELLLVLLLASAGMTYFTTPAYDAALSAHALLFGSLCHGMIGTVVAGNIPLKHANLVFFVYFFSKLAQSAILLTTAVEAVIFSYEYRDACRALRAQRDHVVVKYVPCIVSYIGMILIVCSAQAFLMALLQKM